MSRLEGVAQVVRDAKANGATWRDVGASLGISAGACTGALSRLHSNGEVVRLVDKRDNCSVYVAPEEVHGRAVVERKAPVDGAYTREPRAPREPEPEIAVVPEPEPEPEPLPEWIQEWLTEAEDEDGSNIRVSMVPVLLAAYDRGLGVGNAENDAQWMAGYDQGKDAGIAEGRKLAEEEGINLEELTVRYVEGYETGAKEVRERSVKFIDELARNLRTGSPVHIHNKVCWRTQPACALMLARKSLDAGKPPRVEYDY